MRLHRLHLMLALACGAGALHAQVTPVEPFGGRPFGAATAPAPPAPPPAPQQPVIVQPGAAPVVVQGAPAQQVVVQPPPAAQGGVGPITRPSSSVNAPPAGVPQAAIAPGMAPPPAPPSTPVEAPAPPPPQAAPAMAAPTPSTPPFGGRNAPPGAAAAPAASAAANAAPVKGLPAEAPRLVISGAVVSRDPAKRVLIVNGQPVREGQEAAAGVLVEQVQRDSAVLGFRGQRYTVFF